MAAVSGHRLSMRKKRYVIGLRPIRHLEEFVVACRRMPLLSGRIDVIVSAYREFGGKRT